VLLCCSTNKLNFGLVLPRVLLKSVDYKKHYWNTLDIKKPERLVFIGLSGLYWFLLNLCMGWRDPNLKHKVLLIITFIFFKSTSTTYGTTKTKSHLFYLVISSVYYPVGLSFSPSFNCYYKVPSTS
jgi:hypothetical protein